jgi:hypothetical protein
MALQARDREFRHPRISYLDFKLLEMDRVLTSFLARVWHNGYPSRILRNIELTVKNFVDEFVEHPEWFAGFQDHREVTERWVETHLMDVVNRGKAHQAIAAPRPLHGFTYRFRNPKHSRPYGADEHLYEMLAHAREQRGTRVLEHLKDFFFTGIDKATHQLDDTAQMDIETQALLRLMDQVRGDAPDTRKGLESYPPLCVGAADLLAEDVLRLLFYQRFVPRSVMVDYLKVLFGFHLALYHLRLIKLLPVLIKRRSSDPTCAVERCPMDPRNAINPHGDCPYQIGLLLDVANRPGTPMAWLAERSADTWYRRIPGFVKAYFSVKKLDEFANYLAKHGKLTRPSGGFAVADVLPLLEGMYKGEREPYFKARLASILEDSGGREEDLAPEVAQILEMGLPAFETYIEVVIAHRGDFHRRYLVECLDSLLMKNRPGALIAQSRVKGAPRRFTLDSRLLEVLLQLAVLRPGGTLGYHTASLRIDQVLSFLQGRYGLYIDRLPPGDGFGMPSIQDRATLRKNVTAFTARLQEVGFYRDLSDAYITQTVTPRYTIGKDGSSTSGGEG